MNRRQFNLGLMTLGAAPALSALPARAAAAGLSGEAAMYYPWAVRYAQVHGACSPRRLAGALRLPPDIAVQVFDRLLSQGVVSAPGISGLARAVKPVNWDMQLSSGGHAARSAAAGRRLRIDLNASDEAVAAEEQAETEHPDGTCPSTAGQHPSSPKMAGAAQDTDPTAS